jgi:hypothetical protein
VKHGYSGENKTYPKCIATLENINGLFENVKKKYFSIFHIFIWRTQDGIEYASL